jgi:hypothetical protein
MYIYIYLNMHYFLSLRFFVEIHTFFKHFELGNSQLIVDDPREQFEINQLIRIRLIFLL